MGYRPSWQHSDATDSDNTWKPNGNHTDARQETPRTARILTHRQWKISWNSLGSSVEYARRPLLQLYQLLHSLQPTVPTAQLLHRYPLSFFEPPLSREHAVGQAHGEPTRLAGRNPTSCGSRGATLCYASAETITGYMDSSSSSGNAVDALVSPACSTLMTQITDSSSSTGVRLKIHQTRRRYGLAREGWNLENGGGLKRGAVALHH